MDAKKTKKPELTDEYAQSLLRSVNMEYEQKLAQQPGQKQFFTKRRVIILVVALVVGILLTFGLSLLVKDKGSSVTTQQYFDSGLQR